MVAATARATAGHVSAGWSGRYQDGGVRLGRMRSDPAGVDPVDGSALSSPSVGSLPPSCPGPASRVGYPLVVLDAGSVRMVGLGAGLVTMTRVQTSAAPAAVAVSSRSWVRLMVRPRAGPASRAGPA